MKSKWFLVTTLIAAVNSAAIYQKSLEIPVKILYEKYDYQIPSLRNLNRESQNSSQHQTINNKKSKNDGIRNLEEKPQLSLEQISESGKHIPIPEVDIQNDLEEQTSEIQIFTTDLNNIENIYDTIEQIVLTGANAINTKLNNISNKEILEPVKIEVLAKVNDTLKKFLVSTKILSDKSTTLLKYGQKHNFLQQIDNNFQTVIGNFHKEVAESQLLKQTSTNNPLQMAIYQIQNIFQQISNGINSINATSGTQGTVLGDSQSTQAPNPFQILQSASQQFVQNVNNIINRPTTLSPSANDADEQLSQSDQASPFQTIQTALQNFNPFQQGSQNASVENQIGPLQFIQTAGQQVVNAISSANPFTQSTNSLSDEITSPRPSGPLAFLQNAGQQVVNAFNNANPFNIQTTNNPVTETEFAEIPGINTLGVVSPVAESNDSPGKKPSTEELKPDTYEIKPVESVSKLEFSGFDKEMENQDTQI